MWNFHYKSLVLGFALGLCITKSYAQSFQPPPPTPATASAINNPVLANCIFNTTLPILSIAATAAPCQFDTRANIRVAPVFYTAPGGDGSSIVVSPYDIGTNSTASTRLQAMANYNFNGTWNRQRDIIGATAGGTGTASAAIMPVSAANAGLVSVVSPSAEASRVFKASAGNLYSAYVTNLTATAGFLVILDATSAPADGAITPLECVPLPSSGVATINYNPGPAARFGTGITAVVTSAATCFTKTTGVITAYFKGSVQ